MVRLIKRIIVGVKLGGVGLLFLKLTDFLSHEDAAMWHLYKIFYSTPASEIPNKTEQYYYYKTGNKMDIKHPVTFNEKIQWMKAFDSTPTKTRLADKYLVREYVSKKLGDVYLIPLLGVWDRFDDIDFDRLPRNFVLKTNHGSGWNMIVKDKEKLDKESTRKLFNKWMNTNYAFYSGFEMHYKDIVPKIIAEEYISEDDKPMDNLTNCNYTSPANLTSTKKKTELNHLKDYKIHCFNGVPRFIQFIGDRNYARHFACQCNYDLNWNKLDWIFEDYPAYKRSFDPPERLNEMIKVAAKLSEGMKYVRVDLYEINGRVYFGEMTMTPNSGFYKYRGTFNREKDIELGKMLSIPT